MNRKMLKAHVLLVYAFLYTPLLVLFAYSFNKAGFPGPWQGITPQWYRELFKDIYLWDTFINSLIVAGSSTFLSLLLGILLIFYASTHERANRFVPLFYGNLLIPETFLAVSLLTLFSLTAVPLGFGTLIVAHTLLGLGFVVPILYTRFRALDPALFEASLTLGASPIITFRKITLPLLLPSIFVVALLIFILSLDDFIFSYFCAGSETQTLPLYILSMIRGGLAPTLAPLAMLLVGISVFFICLFMLMRPKERILP